MKLRIYTFASAIVMVSLAASANAQFVVSDPGVEAEVGAVVGELGTANAELAQIVRSTQATATTTANTLSMMNAPTASILGGFAGIEAGGTAEAASDVAEFFPQLNGVTPTSAFSTQLVTAEKAAITADELKGLALGSPANEQAERQRLIGTNVQGEAYNDLRLYASRYAAADAVLPKLSAANLKDAVVWGDGIQLQIFKQLNLIGQSISLNTLAVSESWLLRLKQYFQFKEDHEKAALTFAAPVP